MFIAAGICITVAIGLFLAVQATQTSRLGDAIDKARETGDVTPIAMVISTAPEEKQPAQWDKVLGDMWQAYARHQAAELVVEACRRSDATILQYWIRQVLEVEPEIAEEVFTEEFLNEYFKPDVAARCGKSGCC